MNREFWAGRRVFVTGHTGFKGAWLCLLLERLGAQVAGFALAPPTNPSLYDLADAGARVSSTTADLRDLGQLTEAMRAFQPEVLLHMAAQSVVLAAYEDPVENYSTNVLGTVHVLEAIRTALAGTPRAQPLAVVNVTTDKAYLNQQWPWPYRETDTLGGRDPYSNSKACAELVMQSYRDSYFPAERLAEHGVAVASARAGNVVGGGDWTPHQLVPAVIAAAQRGVPVALRNPAGVRPWQHVLDCLHGYLSLAEQLALAPQVAIGQWNFGPGADEVYDVAQVTELIARHWRLQPAWTRASAETPREEHELRLDCSLAARHLKWRCALDTPTAFDWVAHWHLQVERGATPRQACEAQIDAFLARIGAAEGRA
jgi:CDP-glucose 4,6-dehydratase